MRTSRTFDVAARPDQVVAYLSIPRNCFVVNIPGTILGQSDAPVRTGSWADLAFGQLQVHLEYISFEPPTTIAISVKWRGAGSFGTSGTHTYRIEPIPATRMARITAEVDSPSGWWPAPYVRWYRMRISKRIQQGIDPYAAARP